MAIQARLETLDRRHQELEAALHEEINHPGHDALKVLDIKRRKLAIKDEMETLKAKQQH
jgi:hypothetical protein